MIKKNLCRFPFGLIMILMFFCGMECPQEKKDSLEQDLLGIWVSSIEANLNTFNLELEFKSGNTGTQTFVDVNNSLPSICTGGVKMVFNWSLQNTNLAISYTSVETCGISSSLDQFSYLTQPFETGPASISGNVLTWGNLTLNRKQ